jgi:tetratricopeptide (TPR) repeat protein
VSQAVDASVRDALELYRRGQLADAERLCQDIARHDPGHFGALHLHGIIAFQTGRMEQAAALLRQAAAARPDAADAHANLATALAALGQHAPALLSYDTAIALRPDNAGTLCNRGNVLRLLDRPGDALRDYDRAIALSPDLPQAHYNRGNALTALRRFDDALESFDRALALHPDFAEAHDARGQVLRQTGHYEQALAAYDRAVASRPNLPETHNNRGNALRDLGRLTEALAEYDRAIQLKPDMTEAHNNRGTVLDDLGRPADALLSYDTAIALRPDFPEAHNNRGNALGDLGRHDEALSSYTRALALNPDYADAHDNLGSARAGLGQSEAALPSFERALSLDPDRAETHANRGNVLRGLGRHEDAMRAYAAALALDPGHAAAHWNRSLCQLAMGDYENGWTSFEWRWRSEMAGAKRELSGRRWLGDFPIDGATVFVHAEQGLGDMLQFCRYIPMLAARARVILETPRPLARLLSGLEGVARVVIQGEPPPRYDAWIPLLSLPAAFGTTLETIPAGIPYLSADPERSAAWRRRLATLPGRKVGLVWAGSPRPGQPRANLIDRRRSMALACFGPLAAIPGLSLVSLQKGEPAAQAPPDGMALHDWTAELEDFADTAALVDALDLVISVDTSVAHLAGALGRPVWVLNRYDQCWRWLWGRTDTPWYPTARLFQQDAPGDWSGVIARVVDALQNETRTA